MILLAAILPLLSAGQAGVKKSWTLSDCIDYALSQNIQIRQSTLSVKSGEVNAGQAKAQMLPSVSASARQNFNWANRNNLATGSSDFSGSNSSSLSLSSNITLYSGSKLANRAKQAGLDLQSSLYSSETIKESVQIGILNSFLQVLYADEQAKNSRKQLEATEGQLKLAEERLALSIISKSDYLQVKSQLASEKLSLANAESQLSIAKVNLMQLMELPVDSDFTIVNPGLETTINQNLAPNAAEIYQVALGIKPQIKNAEVKKESAALDEKIAKAGYLPTISADAGLSTGYSSQNTSSGYFNQLGDQISPSVGVGISIPIFQKYQAKGNVTLAKIGYESAELDETNTRNQLRKEIEQACLDVVSAQSQYDASNEQYESTAESYALAEEKFKQGLINSVDFLFEKTNLIVAESQTVQAKYNLIFSYKILDFYSGIPIVL